MIYHNGHNGEYLILGGLGDSWMSGSRRALAFKEGGRQEGREHLSKVPPKRNSWFRVSGLGFRV